MYRAGRLRRVFRARGKLVGTSDFVVTKGYVQIRVVGFPWETASLSVAAGGARRRGVPVSNCAVPLLGGPWASKLRPPSERSVPRRRLAPRFAG